MTLSTYRDYEETASTERPEAHRDPVAYCWDVLGYELIPASGWETSEAEILGLADVQEALEEGLRELRALKERQA